MQQGLSGRSDARHDYEQESWKALSEYFGNLEESDTIRLAILLSRGTQ